MRGGWAADGRSLVYMEDPPTNNARDPRPDAGAGRRRNWFRAYPREAAGRPCRPMAAGSPSCRGQRERPDINVQPFPGPGLRRQIVEGGSEPVWSRDGRELFFRSRRGAARESDRADRPTKGSSRCRSIPCAGEASAQAGAVVPGRFAPAPGHVPMYDVTPDGQRFVVVMAGDEEFAPLHLNVIMNIDDELRRRVPAGK